MLSTVVPLLIVIGTYMACREHYRPNIMDYTLLAVCSILFLVWNTFSDLYRRGSNKLRVIYQIAAQIALLFALFTCFSEVTLTLLLAGQLLLLVVWQRLRGVILPGLIIKVLAIILLIRLSMNMYILYYVSPLHIGSWGIPWTLYGFSIPIICLWLGARWLPVRDGDQTRAWLAGNAIYLLALWINVELRHLLHGSYHLSFDFSSLTDSALHAVTFGIMALAYGYRERTAESLRFVYRLAAQISAGLMLLLTFLCLSLFNPIWSSQSVGSLPLFNMVTVAYLIPMLSMLLALRFWPNEWLDTHLKPYVAGAVALLGMVFITLTVCQLWHGNFLDAHQIYNGEQYSYSLMWMVTAIAMMYHAIRWPNRIIRRASLGLLALTIAKLFLWDMAGLHGLYRSLSFLGLGLCLVAVGWFYQKYVVLADAAEQNTAEIGSENRS